RRRCTIGVMSLWHLATQLSYYFFLQAEDGIRVFQVTGVQTCALPIWAAQRAEFPARFQLVAAMNPCPCGFAGSHQRACRCTPDQIGRASCRERVWGAVVVASV